MSNKFHTVKGHDIMSLEQPPTALDPRTNGEVFQIWEVLKTEPIEVHYTRINAGENTGAHMHPDASHYLIIIKGLAHVWIDEQILVLEPGDFLEIPRYLYHDFSADPSGDVWDLSVTNPGWDTANMTYDAEFGEQNRIREALEKSFGMTEKRLKGGKH